MPMQWFRLFRTASVALAATMALAAMPAMTSPVLAQGAASQDPVAEARASFKEVADFVTKSAALVPADKYTYRPTAGVRTFGQLVAHVADGYAFFCAMAGGEQVQWSDPIEKGALDKATLTTALAKAQERCSTTYAAGKTRLMIGNIGHANLHYGNMITYIRMLGLVPPSS